MPEKYTKQEVDSIQEGLNVGTGIDAISEDLGRTPYGVALKLRVLVEEDPSLWDPGKVRDYIRAEIKKHRGDRKGQKERWRKKHSSKKTKWLVEGLPKVNQGKFREYLAGIIDSCWGGKKDFALKMGVCPTLLSHFLSGDRFPSIKFLEKLAEREGVCFDEFMARFQN